MRCICDEPPLRTGRSVEPVEHVVHGRGEVGDLVAGVGHLQSLVEPSGLDVLDFGADPRHRCKRPAGEDPCTQRDEPDQDRDRGGEEPAGSRNDLQPVVDLMRHHHLQPAVLDALLRHHEHVVVVDDTPFP